MSAKAAEVYERIKDLRRQGDGSEIQSRIGHHLKAMYDDAQGGRDRLAGLVGSSDSPHGAAVPPANLIRVLEIKTLADRVFGDEQKAEAWLQRSSPSLSGKKPVDLLKDELGTAVVRELLEQIDHGIFA
jgi:hypothetical protein